MLVSTQELKSLRYFTLSLMWLNLELAWKYPGELMNLCCFTLSLMWLILKLACKYPGELEEDTQAYSECLLQADDTFLGGKSIIVFSRSCFMWT